MLIGSGVLFVLFSDSTEQHWNKLEDKGNGNGNRNDENQYSKVPLDDFTSNEKWKEASQLKN